MCGIVGANAEIDVVPILLQGLKRLEYRGYDSAGIAILQNSEQLHAVKVKGKVQELINQVKKAEIKTDLGIAHTRWATHGVPSEINAHPHLSENQVAIVHNGIIENFDKLKLQLQKAGYQFRSDTDTEVIAHLLAHHLKQQPDPLQAILAMTKELQGAYALAILLAAYPQKLFAVRCGSPLVIGKNEHGAYLASDALALLGVAEQFIYLQEGDIACLEQQEINIFDQHGKPALHEWQQPHLTLDAADKGKYRHYMQKEIHEQPQAFMNTLEGRIYQQQVLEHIFGHDAKILFDQAENVHIIACGTSYHAGLIGKYWLEALAGIPTMVEVASEYRYREFVVPKNTLFVTISQSGETADTLAALHLAKEKGYLASLTICNVPESSLVRESDLVIMTRAGVEIGVASTKAFTTQLNVMLLLALCLQRRYAKKNGIEAELVQQLQTIPRLMQSILDQEQKIMEMAKLFADKSHALFLGRGAQYPVALEGALKLKEISYIHAEAYPAGELKHGPLALVDKNMPVVAIVANDELLEKLKSNLQEVHARGGKLFVFADENIQFPDLATQLVRLPKIHKYLAPFIYTIPLQLLAYHVAVQKGTDVDQPRNLAKSVTVE